MRKIDEIIVHCTATRREWMEGRTARDKAAEIDRWHRARGWRMIGYHAIIDRDGTVMKGRGDAEQGAHVAGRNAHSLGVSLVGGHGSSATDEFEDHFTASQNTALRNYIRDKKAQYGIEKISGHNEHSAKACPGFNVAKWLARQPKPVAPRLTFWDRLFAALKRQRPSR